MCIRTTSQWSCHCLNKWFWCHYRWSPGGGVAGSTAAEDTPIATGASDSSCGLRRGPSITTGQNQIKLSTGNANVFRQLALAQFKKKEG